MRTSPPLLRLLALALAPHRRSARKRAIAAFGLALAFVPTARAATYTFTKIADNSGELREFGLPSINNLRRVGWKHERWIDVGSWQIEKPPTP